MPIYPNGMRPNTDLRTRMRPNADLPQWDEPECRFTLMECARMPIYPNGMRPNADLPQWNAPECRFANEDASECRFANNGMRPERARLHLAQGIALGYTEGGLFALKGQKPSTHINAFALTGRMIGGALTTGRCPGL